MIHALLLTMLAGVGSPAIRVDETTIPASVLTARAAMLTKRGMKATREIVTQGLVEETLLALDARRTGIASTPAARSAIANERNRVLAELFVDRDLARNTKASEELLRSLYHSTADAVRLQLVVVETEGAAKAVLDRLQSGGEIELEAARSLDPASAAKRGDTGNLLRGQLPPGTEGAVFKAGIGDLVGPIPWGAGWAVARVIARSVGDEAGFSAQRAALERHAQSLVISQAKQHFLKVLRERERIAIDEKFLDALGDRVAPSGDEADHVLAVVRGEPVRYRDVLPVISEMANSQSVAHRIGPAVKSRIVSQYIDERILAALAVERGLDKADDGPALLQAAENSALAGRAIAGLVGGLPSGAPIDVQRKALRDRVVALRSRAAIKIDEAQVRAALPSLP